jgi:DNA-binding CsgD family transcriptional regulator
MTKREKILLLAMDGLRHKEIAARADCTVAYVSMVLCVSRDFQQKCIACGTLFLPHGKERLCATCAPLRQETYYNRRRRQGMSHEERQQRHAAIRKMRADGWKISEIAEITGLSPMTIETYCRRCTKTPELPK